MNPYRPFKQFNEQEDRIWQLLWQKQWHHAEDKATQLWLQGIDLIGLTGDHIPNFAALSERIHSLTGWRLISTDVQYSSGQDWFEALARKEFLITEYIRTEDVLDYTPLPDIFHDAFGHLPFLAHQHYADYLHRFALTAIQHPPTERASLGSLWWYTIEFGFLRENGKLKALGAGLMSSVAELKRAYSDTIIRQPYSLAAFETLAPSPHQFHDTLFILDSWAQVESALTDWARQHPPEKQIAR